MSAHATKRHTQTKDLNRNFTYTTLPLLQINNAKINYQIGIFLSFSLKLFLSALKYKNYKLNYNYNYLIEPKIIIQRNIIKLSTALFLAI
ncbi:hypothetical protein DVG78_07795 [Runella aurantiaca]|uniref:Uncharacterized protein n=1 Tax=Runella aurantiaca TaxID=2282308 RepID=A0A369IC64_9BACT|nr:hypothetical protein DVG78_07795 [Runella aurantiaca]